MQFASWTSGEPFAVVAAASAAFSLIRRRHARRYRNPATAE